MPIEYSSATAATQLGRNDDGDPQLGSGNLCGQGNRRLLIVSQERLGGSASVLIGNMPAARMGDQTAHGGTIAVGCPTVLIGDGSADGGGATAGGAGTGAGGGVATAEGAGSGADSHQTARVDEVSSNQAGPLEAEEPEDALTWIGIVLRDFDDTPMPGQDFQVTLEGGQVLSGTTNDEGYCRFDDVDPDKGEVAFTQIAIEEGGGSQRQQDGQEEQDQVSQGVSIEIPPPPEEEEDLDLGQESRPS